MSSHVISVRVDEQLYKQITAEVQKTGNSMGEVLRMRLGNTEMPKLQAKLRRKENEVSEITTVMYELMDHKTRLEKQVATLISRYDSDISRYRSALFKLMDDKRPGWRSENWLPHI
jgi:predicted transcriptional regulator